jgi:hypothetical protein
LRKRLYLRGCRLDLDQPWNLDDYFYGHITDSVNIVAWALDKVIKECLGDPLSPRLITRTIERNVWNSTLKLSAALNSTPIQVVFDDRAHRVLPMALGNLVNGRWIVAGVYDPTSKQFLEKTNVIKWPRTGRQAPRAWLECPAGQITEARGELLVCESCAAGTASLGGQASSCNECLPGAISATRSDFDGGIRPNKADSGAGFFQPYRGQLGCIDCDSLGDVYQERRGQTSCQVCMMHTQRYLGVLSAVNKSACQCKEGLR